MTTVIERAPAAGSKTAIVLEHLKKGDYIVRDISDQTGLPEATVRSLKAYSHRAGYLSPPTTAEELEQDRSERRRSISYSKGRKWVRIEPFARMGMLGVEITEAIPLKTGEYLSPTTIDHVVSHAKQIGELPKQKRTEEEKKEIWKQRVAPKEEIRGRVKLWLTVSELLEQNSLEQLPSQRNDWLILSDWFHAHRERALGNEELLIAAGRKASALPKDRLIRLQPCLDLISDQAASFKITFFDREAPPTEKVPRSGTKIAQVLPFLKNDLPVKDIAAQTGLSQPQVRAIREHARKVGYLPKLTDQDREKIKQETRKTISLSRGGEWVTVETFAKMGMLTVEILEAVKLGGTELSYLQVQNAVHKAKGRGDLPGYKRTKEEEKEAWESSHQSKEVIQERVKLWLEVVKLLSEYHLTHIPTNRTDWLFLVKGLNNLDADPTTSQELLTRLAPCIELIQEISATKEKPDLRVTKAVGGDQEAFGELYEENIDQIYTQIYYRVGNPQDAEDLATQVFLNAWRGISKYRNMGRPFKVWLLSIANNLIIDHYRLRRKNRSLEEVDFLIRSEDYTVLEAEHKMEQEARVKMLEAAIPKLKKDQQKVLALRFFDNMEYADIATLMEKSEGAIRVIYHRALDGLRNILHKEGIDSETNYELQAPQEQNKQDLQQYHLKDIARTIGKGNHFTTKLTPIIQEVLKRHGSQSTGRSGGREGFLLSPDEFVNVCEEIKIVLKLDEERFRYADLQILTKMSKDTLRNIVRRMKNEGELAVSGSGNGFSKDEVRTILKYLGIEAS